MIQTGEAVEASDFAKITPVGTILPYGGSSAPDEYLLCDGSAVSRLTYAALFAAIGTTFGVGDGSTTFNVPDIRGRFPLGKDNMGGSSANRVTATEADTLGAAAGEEKHTLTTAEMPSHAHSLNDVPTTHAGGATSAGTGSGRTTQTATGSEGSDSPHNNMPPYITLNFIIRHATYA